MNKRRLAVLGIALWAVFLAGTAVSMHEETHLDATASVTDVTVENDSVQSVSVQIENREPRPLSLTVQVWQDGRFTQFNWNVIDVPAETTSTVTLEAPEEIEVRCETLSQMQFLDGDRRIYTVFRSSDYSDCEEPTTTTASAA